MDYAQTDGYSPMWRMDKDREAITDLWDEGKIEEGMKLAEKWLEKVPVDIQMQGWYSHFLETKGDFSGSIKHYFIKLGLIHSITSSGTGLSPDSPWKVISVHEEYDILGNIGAQLISQSLGKTSEGRPCDVMVCKIGEKKITLYFDVSISMEATSKLLNPSE